MTLDSEISDVLVTLRSQGACAGADPSIFFPVSEKNYEDVGKALVFCSGCPVLEECYDHAMANEFYGIWGGTSARQRRSLRRKFRMKGPE